MNRGFPTGNEGLDGIIREAVGEVEALLEGRQLGFYLHGSTFTGTRTPTSDIDVLGLGDENLNAEDNRNAKAAVLGLSTPSGVELDMKVFSAATFRANPWINIWTGAALVAGRDWASEMPLPSLDALARESVLHACHIVSQGANALSAKRARWLATTLLAVRHGSVPSTSRDALEALRRHEPPLALLIDGADELSREIGSALVSTVRDALCADVSLPRPILGERCHQLIRQHLLD